ncbi:MAG: hypothetical protein JXQ66_01190 [Campylobacterales bacterium]|nr:hypothetical protein [Campylobacterales bacterium]
MRSNQSKKFLKLVFILLFVVEVSLFAKPVLNCATSHVRDVAINELYNGGGGGGSLEIVEIYFNKTTDITNWKLYFHDRNTNQEIVIGTGVGVVSYPDGSSGIDNISTYPKGTFIVYDIGGIDPTNGEMFIANTTDTLEDGDSVLIDYFKYYKTKEETVYDVDDYSECSILLHPTDSNAKDISRLTDGSGDFYQYYPGTDDLITVTEGSSNLEGLPPDSTLSANVSISAEFNQSEAYNGDEVTLTLTITNAAEDSITVTDVNITNIIPAGLEYVSDDGGTLLDPTLPSNPYGETTSTFIWRLINGSNILSFPTDSTAKVNIILKVNSCDNNITNTATLSIKQTNNGTTTDSASLYIPYSFIVDDDAFECPNACFTTIQDAVNASSGGETIEICKGSYNESVSLIKKDNITFTSGGGVLTPTDVDWNHNQYILTVGSTSGTDNGSDNVKIENISFRQTGTNSNYNAIYLKKGVDVEINNVVIDAGYASAIYAYDGHFSGDGIYKNLDITTKANGIYINKGDLQTFEDINMSLTGTNANYKGIYIGQNVTDQNHQFKNLIFASNTQTAIYVNNGNDMTFDNIDVNSTNNDSDYRDVIYTGDNVDPNADLIFKDITLNMNKGRGIMVKKATDTIYENITINGSSSYAIYSDQNVQGHPSFTNINISANKEYGLYIGKGQNVTVDTANISGVSGTGHIVYLHPNAQGSHLFKDINATSSSHGFYIDTASRVEFNNVKANIISPNRNYYGIRTRENVTGDVVVTNSEINATGMALSIDKGIPKISSSKFVSQDNHAVFVNTNTNNVSLQDSCLYTEGDYAYDYSFKLNNSKKNAKVNNNCFYGEPDTTLAWSLTANDFICNMMPWMSNCNNFIGNYWDGHSGSYTYNNVNDNMPLNKCPNSCAYNGGSNPPSEKNYKFDAWDTFRYISDRNISTKIASQDFNITIASLNEVGDAYQDFNGTVCAKVIDENGVTLQDWSEISEFANTTTNTHISNLTNINIDKAVKKVKVKIKWFADVNKVCSTQADENNETNSTDAFAIRPKEFVIASSSSLKASEEFGFNLKANDGSNNFTTDYNKTLSLSHSIHDASKVCSTPDLDFNISSVSFVNGESLNSANFGDVGEVDVNITDTTWSSEDVDDTPQNCDGNATHPIGAYICSDGLTITVVPYQFGIVNYSFERNPDKSWRYMGDVDDMNISLEFNIQAQNKDAAVTENFDLQCYGGSVGFDIEFDVTSLDANLSYQQVYNNTKYSGHDKNLGDINLTDTINDANFIEGNSSIISYALNIYRDYETPKNPIKIDALEINTTNGFGSINIGKTLSDDSLFYYGRVRASDIETTKDMVEHFAEVEVYDSVGSSFVSGFKQNTINWYRNKEEDNSSVILDINGTSSSLLNNPTINIGHFSISTNGKVDFDISNTTSGVYNMHIKTKKWLWYVPGGYGDDYNDSVGSGCLAHPCFKYTRKNSSGFSGIRSGEFSGSDYNITDRGEYERTGVKVFR